MLGVRKSNFRERRLAKGIEWVEVVSVLNSKKQKKNFCKSGNSIWKYGRSL